MTFQSLILKLSEFWASRGCALQQPLDIEVGAGTMHPGDVPARARTGALERRLRAAVAPAGRRPLRRESRTGLFKHHQFQVILKPAPDEVQQLYLESLEACGINPRQHDIRFEEDNWESPTLGAWGIGWQVMFDGMEISQFTYFQQAGGIELAPISAELTYGLERIAMVLQRVDSMYDLEWAPGVKYRDVRLREEIEQSKYVFGQVDMPAGEFGAFHRDLFDRYYQFAEPLLETRSDLAGARALPEVLAPVQHPRREQQHRRDRADRLHPARAAAGGRHREGLRRPTARARQPSRRRRRVMDRELLLEIGCEELPAELAARPDAIRSARSSSPSCASTGCRPESPAETFSTPRRLTVRVARLPERQTDLEELVNGPPVSASFTARRHADAGRRRLRREAGRRGRGARAGRDAEGRVPGVPQAAARQGRRRRAARRARRHAARR